MLLWKTDITPINSFIMKNKYIKKDYIVMKTKKDHIFRIKDGLFNFNMNTKNLTCKCLSDDIGCKHLINYLLDLGLSWTNCYMVLQDSNMKQLLIDNIKSEDINKLLYENIEECMICLEPIKKFREAYCCIKCHKIIHHKCIIKWINSKNENNHKCPHCMDNIIY